LIRTRVLLHTWGIMSSYPRDPWGIMSSYARVIRPMGLWAELLDFLAVVTAVMLILVVETNRVGAARIVLALCFTFFVPGRAVVANWPRMARWSQAGMPMVLSLAITGLVTTVALWLHLWHPVQIFLAEAGLSLVGLVVSIVRRRRIWSLEDSFRAK
jgi:hypothetical protein